MKEKIRTHHLLTGSRGTTEKVEKRKREQKREDVKLLKRQTSCISRGGKEEESWNRGCGFSLFGPIGHRPKEIYEFPSGNKWSTRHNKKYVWSTSVSVPLAPLSVPPSVFTILSLDDNTSQGSVPKVIVPGKRTRN